jgi:hypothetical protein
MFLSLYFARLSIFVISVHRYEYVLIVKMVFFERYSYSYPYEKSTHILTFLNLFVYIIVYLLFLHLAKLSSHLYLDQKVGPR